MRVLRETMKGDDVLALQQRLKARGFPPGEIDAEFGPATEAAVIAFQRGNGLLADGVVGERTALALGFDGDDVPAPEGMPPVTVAIAARMFPATPLVNIKRNLPPVLEHLKGRRLTSTPIVLCALATIRAETEGFVPINEGLSRFNTSPGGHPFDLYDNRTDLGNRGAPDGERFKGRGFVQLTGRDNYQRFGQIIGLGDGLIADPDKANDTEIAAELLAAFIGSKETAIKQALLADDLAAARRLVNGGDHGLDRFTDAYRIGERLVAPAPLAPAA
jgi:peptidoglycan L-alanyl-D-glutamate endopeptidase CwlK